MKPLSVLRKTDRDKREKMWAIRIDNEKEGTTTDDMSIKRIKRKYYELYSNKFDKIHECFKHINDQNSLKRK